MKDELDNLLKVIDDVLKNYRAQIYEKSMDFHRDIAGAEYTARHLAGPIRITLKYSFSLPNFHKTDKLGWTEITHFNDDLFGR